MRDQVFCYFSGSMQGFRLTCLWKAWGLIMWIVKEPSKFLGSLRKIHHKSSYFGHLIGPTGKILPVPYYISKGLRLQAFERQCILEPFDIEWEGCELIIHNHGLGLWVTMLGGWIYQRQWWQALACRQHIWFILFFQRLIQIAKTWWPSCQGVRLRAAGCM